MLFENPSIPITSLPDLSEHSLESLSPAYLKVSQISTILFFSILIAILSGIYYFAEFSIPYLVQWAVPAAWLFLFLFSLWHTWRNFKVQGFLVREHDLTYRTGVFFRKTIVIPYNRVQHCEVRQGPIERQFNLRRLEVFTAGGESSDLSIPGLGGERAEQLKTFVIEKTGQHENN